MIIKRPLILDVSHWEQDSSWTDDTPLLVIAKLTQGKSFIDAAAGDHIEGASAAGAYVGVYHFLEQDDIAAQIDNFIENAELAGALKAGI